MTVTDWFLGALSTCASIVTVYAFVRSAISKAREEAKVEVLRQQIATVERFMVGVFHGADAIVQIAKAPNATVREVQEHARVLRGLASIAARELGSSRRRLAIWRFGALIPSAETSKVSSRERQQLRDEPAQEVAAAPERRMPMDNEN